MKPILFTFAFAATLAVQNFIQMSDPQFRMFKAHLQVGAGRAGAAFAHAERSRNRT